MASHSTSVMSSQLLEWNAPGLVFHAPSPGQSCGVWPPAQTAPESPWPA